MELTKESRQKSREDKFSYEYSGGQSRTEIRKPGGDKRSEYSSLQFDSDFVSLPPNTGCHNIIRKK